MPYTIPPTLADIHALAELALSRLPASLAAQVQNVAIMVEDLADDELLHDLDIEHPWELTGVYQGVPITERGVAPSGSLPDQILLFREAILLEWVESNEDLTHLVGSVLIHEIAHHFGFSDADIARLEAEFEAGLPSVPATSP